MIRWTFCSQDVSKFIFEIIFLYKGDGIFDKISNAEVLKQAWIAAKKNFHAKDQPIHQICGYVVEQVMKASVSYKTLDNITVVMLAFKNFKFALAEEFTLVNDAKNESKLSELFEFIFLLGNHDILNKESGQAGTSAAEEQSQVPRANSLLVTSPAMGQIGQNALVENLDSSNGGLQYVENAEGFSFTKEDVLKRVNLPNGDVTFSDAEIMQFKPKMPAVRRSKNSRASHISKNNSMAGAQYTQSDQQSSDQ